jgi:hypothetical protein
LEVQIDYWKPDFHRYQVFYGGTELRRISTLDAVKVNKRWREVVLNAEMPAVASDCREPFRSAAGARTQLK